MVMRLLVVWMILLGSVSAAQGDPNDDLKPKVDIPPGASIVQLPKKMTAKEVEINYICTRTMLPSKEQPNVKPTVIYEISMPVRRGEALGDQIERASYLLWDHRMRIKRTEEYREKQDEEIAKVKEKIARETEKLEKLRPRPNTTAPPSAPNVRPSPTTNDGAVEEGRWTPFNERPAECRAPTNDSDLRLYCSVKRVLAEVVPLN